VQETAQPQSVLPKELLVKKIKKPRRAANTSTADQLITTMKFFSPDDKYVSHFDSQKPKQWQLIALRAEGLRADLLEALVAETEPKLRARFKRHIDSIDAILADFGDDGFDVSSFEEPRVECRADDGYSDNGNGRDCRD
jgi:hypothetical protein